MEKQKILIVEDEQVNRAILVHMLSKKYDIIEAENGSDAFDKLRNYQIELILLDLIMPVMGGIEFLEKRREYDDYADIPVIITTHDSDPVIEATAFDLGAKEFVVKPYNANVLFKRIRDHLKKEPKQENLKGVTIKLSSDKLLDLLDHVPVGVAVFEVRGLIDFLYYNNSFSSLLGYTVQELEDVAPDNPFDLIYEDDVDFLTHKVNQAIMLGIDLEVVVRAYKKDHSIVYLEVNGQLYREENSFPQFYAMFKEVTEECL